MTKKKLIKYTFGLALMGLGLSSISAYAEEDTSYYVCFSYDNYQVKNTNRMKGIDTDSDGSIDYYELENKTLNSSMDFYVISGKEEKYYGSDGSNMKVEEEDSYKYNLFFNPNQIYDEAYVVDTEYFASNANISYSYYVPGHFSLDIDGTVMDDFSYNHYVTSYDAYILPEASYMDGSVVTITNLDDSTVYQKTIEHGGNYRLVFTPTVTKNSNEYRFDSEGSYGTGDAYTENISLTDVEYYYISYFEDMHPEGEKTTFTIGDEEITAYRLVKDEKRPTANVFRSNRIFSNEKDNKIEYTIYHYSYIFGKYEVIDDDNDKDTDVSEQKLSDVCWYEAALTFADGKYSTVFSKSDTDFSGYYMVGEFNHYGFNNDGTLNLDEKYLFTTVESDSSYYDKDAMQFLLEKFIITKDMLDYDDDDYVFYISNGKSQTSKITIKTPGTYDILYSKETSYNGSSYKYIRTVESDEVYTTYTISTVEEFQSFVDEWNMDSESSKYVIYDIVADLSFYGVDISSISMFHGTLNGNGHELSYISIYEENECDEVGLFKLVTKYATIRDLEITHLSIDAEKSTYVGFITKNYGRIENVTIDGEIKGERYVGAVAGYNGNYQQDSDTSSDSTVKYGYGVLENVVNHAKVTGKIIVGGLSGFNGGKIIHSNNTADINHKSYSSSVRVINIGGLVGYSTGEIVDSWNNGVVGYSQIGSNIGGISGLCNGEIYYSCNTGVVYGKENVGGIVGYFGSQSADNSETTSKEAMTESYVNSLIATDKNDLDYQEESDISSHIIVYCYNVGDVHATSYSGGITGYANSSTLSIKNGISMCNVYADSGSYAGGVCGYLNAGEIISSAFLGYIEANGSINRYVGGICGYSNAKVEACLANATLNGNEYVGGLLGYATSSASLISCYTNVYMITKTSSKYIGNVAGFIDGIDASSGTYGDRVKYNYYLGSDLNDYSGINNVNYGKASHYAASRFTFKDAQSTKFLDTVSHRFGEREDDENYYIAGSYLPYLKAFSVLDEIDDEDFDDNTDSYAGYEFYYNRNLDKYLEFQKKVSEFNARIIFKEWDSELDDNEYDNYKVVKILTISYETGIDSITYPEFVYADKNNKTQRKDMLYSVSWNPVERAFKNQTIYASYAGIVNSIYDNEYDIFIEGSFQSKEDVTIAKVNNTYQIALKNPQDVVVKIHCDKPDRTIVSVNGEKISSRVYGDYVEFTLAEGQTSFALEEGPFTFSMLPDYVVALMVVVPLLILVVVGVVISNVKSYKKRQNEEASTPLDNKEEDSKE